MRQPPPVRLDGPGPIPALSGIGAKPQHFQDLLRQTGEGASAISWIEVHAENYMGEGGRAHHALDELRQIYPLSLHGVGLSLGTAGPLDTSQLLRLRSLIERFEPAMVSEHLAWSRTPGACFNDLLPVPCTVQSLQNFCDHVDQTQEVLGCRILIENPSAYLQPSGPEMSELDFLVETVRRTGCRLLLDVNNVYVTAQNLNLDPEPYIDEVPVRYIEEIHLAGYTVDDRSGTRLLIDTHGARVSEPVWTLYERLIARAGPLPTLIEWDTDVPKLEVLSSEAKRANRIMGQHRWLGEQHGAL